MLKTREVIVWLRKPLRSTGAVASDALANCGSALRVAVVVENNLNVVADVRVVGNTNKETANTLPITGWTPCDANSRLLIGLATEEWLTWMGIEVKTPTQAGSGVLEVKMYVQEES